MPHSIYIDDRNPLFLLGEIYESDQNKDWTEKGDSSIFYTLVPRCIEPFYRFIELSPELIFCHKRMMDSQKNIIFEAGKYYYNFSKFGFNKPHLNYMILLSDTGEYIDFQNVPVEILYEFFSISSSFYSLPKVIKEMIPLFDFNQSQSLLAYKENLKGNWKLLMTTERIGCSIESYRDDLKFMISPLRIGNQYQVNYDEDDEVMPIFFENHGFYQCERKNCLTDRTGSKFYSILTNDYQFTSNIKEISL